MWGPFGWFFGSIFGIIVFIIALFIYFLPTFIAIGRNHRNKLAIFLVNLFLGGTVVGWIVALIWSLAR
jgi:hypothetical protein